MLAAPEDRNGYELGDGEEMIAVKADGQIVIPFFDGGLMSERLQALAGAAYRVVHDQAYREEAVQTFRLIAMPVAGEA